MREEDTPIYNRAGIGINTVTTIIEEEMADSTDGLLSFDHMQLMSKVIPQILTDQAEADSVREKLLEGLEILKSIGSDFPDIAEEVTAGSQLLIMGVFQLVTELIDKKIVTEVAKIAPLAKHNSKKLEAQKAACALAEEMWEEDKDKKIRISEMATNVFIALQNSEHADNLPDHHVTVKDWIKSVAPDYARKGGKPRNTP